VSARGGVSPFGHDRRGHKHARDLRRAGVEQHARGHEPAVHGEDVTRDVGGFVRGEEGSRGGHFLGCAVTLDRQMGESRWAR
jgi:hypothetical protein